MSGRLPERAGGSLRRGPPLKPTVIAPTTYLNRLRVCVGHGWRFAERHRLEDRSSGSERLLILIAGHKELLWPWTLDRVSKHVPSDLDVCLVTPGVDLPKLADLAREHGWSYLATRGGHVSVAQNLALRAHPDARYVFKVDEDVFVPQRFFESLFDGYLRVKEEAEFSLGFCAPILNVNGFSYVDYLDALGQAEAYRERFGTLRRASDGIPVHHDGNAAVWLWERGLPVEEIATEISKRPFRFSVVPHRFSIGAILFERDLWEGMNGFKRLQRSPGLGEDEQHICVECLSRSRIMAVLQNVYAGHFAFGPQQPAMEAAFGSRLSEF